MSKHYRIGGNQVWCNIDLKAIIYENERNEELRKFRVDFLYH